MRVRKHIAENYICQWKRAIYKFSSKHIACKERSKFSSYRRCGKKKEKKMLDFFFLIFPTAVGGTICIFLVPNCQLADRNELVRRSTLDFDIDSAHSQPLLYLAWPTNEHDGHQDIRSIHGTGGESLPLRYALKPEFCERDGGVFSPLL